MKVIPMSERKSVRPYHHPAGGWGALKALYAHDPLSFTPSSKGIPVRIVRSAAASAPPSVEEEY
jgi:hypothetical protein